VSTDFRIPRNGWTLVCDGAKALVLENEGDAELVNRALVRVMEAPSPPTRELGTDRPGRTHQAGLSGRSAVEDTDWHDQAETEFLATVVREVEGMVRRCEIKSLLVVAPPRALGVLRDKFPASLQAIVTAELAKDLVRLPTEEIERHLAG
jgi:protein required for attachment to host cells